MATLFECYLVIRVREDDSTPYIAECFPSEYIPTSNNELLEVCTIDRAWHKPQKYPRIKSYNFSFMLQGYGIVYHLSNNVLIISSVINIQA